MLKKLSSISFIMVIVFLLGSMTFANNPKNYISITKPKKDMVTVTKNTYNLCGITDYDNIRVELYRIDSRFENADDDVKDRAREFRYPADPDDETSWRWDIGPSGFFNKRVTLSRETTVFKTKDTSVNVLKIKAYDRSRPKDPPQVIYKTIKVIEESDFLDNYNIFDIIDRFKV